MNALELKGIIDFSVPEGGASGKALELNVLRDIQDLNLYALGIAGNGGGTDGPEAYLPNVPAYSGERILVCRDKQAMENYLTSEVFNRYQHVFQEEITNGSGADGIAAINHNGNDAIELFFNGNVIETFGDPNVNGTGQPWEYLDSWAYKANGYPVPVGGGFDINAWVFGGINVTDGTATIFQARPVYPFASQIYPIPKNIHGIVETINTGGNTQVINGVINNILGVIIDCPTPIITMWVMTYNGVSFDGTNDPSIISYTLEYSTSLFTPGDGTANTYTFNSFPHTFNGLSSGTTYYFAMASNCASGAMSEYIGGPDTWITAPNDLSGTGSYMFTHSVTNNGVPRPPVEVFYHIPSGVDKTEMRILLSFHGASRNANDYRDAWISAANDKGFAVFAPEFNVSDYALNTDYITGGIFDNVPSVPGNYDIQDYNEYDEWTLTIAKELFDNIKYNLSSTQTKAWAWGHSGGSQFLHRFLLYKGSSIIEKAVCSNAGWYTFPDVSLKFPYGLDYTDAVALDAKELGNAEIQAFLESPIVVHLGTSDTNPNSSGLRHNDIVDNQQGYHRYERGNTFYTFCENLATASGYTFNWTLRGAQGVGHDEAEMASDAVSIFFPPSTLIINEVHYDPASGDAGDANNDGTRDANQDEFIEFVNNTSTDSLDLTGWTVDDTTSLAGSERRHTFPSGTVLAPGQALVLFGGGTPNGDFGGALVQTANGFENRLNMNNSGDLVTVKDSEGAVQLTFDVEPLSNNPDEAYTRNPDITGEFVQHSGVNGALFTPGTKADGTSFT